MSATLPSLTRVGLRFVVTFGAVTLLWAVFLQPGYDRFIATVGVQALRLVESPRLTAGVRMEGAYAVVTHTAAAPKLKEQRLELGHHHNNIALLLALILVTPGLTRRRRERTLLLAMGLLAITHVLHFMLAVHWGYGYHNVGQYKVTDLSYAGRSLWESRDNSAQLAKMVVFRVEGFYSHVGRRLMPVLLWMILCRDALSPAVLRNFGRADVDEHSV